MLYSNQLGKILGQISKTINQLDCYADHTCIASSEEKDQTKRSELENNYFTLHYYIILLSKIEKSIHTLRWFYSSQTLVERFQLQSISQISAKNLEEIIQNISQANEIFNEHKIRLDQQRRLKEPLRGLFFGLVAAAIAGGVCFGIFCIGLAGAPLPLTIFFCIFLSLLFSGIVSLVFSPLFNINETIDKAISFLDEVQTHCDAYTKNVPVHISIAEGAYTHTPKLGRMTERYSLYCKISYPKESDTPKTPESCFFKFIPERNHVVSKTTSNTQQIKSNFFEKQDVANTTLAQRALMFGH